jgi:hypothetical protein
LQQGGTAWTYPTLTKIAEPDLNPWLKILRGGKKP